MGSHLEQRMRDIIRREWNAGTIPIDSENIYNEVGDVPEGAMDEVFSDLEQRGLIRSTGSMNPERKKTHGNRKITWVSDLI